MGRGVGRGCYDLWVWDSIDRQFGPIGGALTGRSFTHTVLTDGRNYHYRVRAHNASGVRARGRKGCRQS